MASDFDELKALLIELLTNRFAPKPQFTRGLLGDGLGNVTVPTRPDKNYVRFNRGSSEFFEVFNVTVNAVNDWPVLIGELPWSPGLTQVVATDWDSYEQSGWGDNVGATSPHGPTHEWPDGSPGSDAINIYMRSIVPLRAYTLGTGSTTIYANSYEYENPNGSGTVWGGLPGKDLGPVMSALPTGTARLMGIYLDPNLNTLGIVTGATDIFTDASDPPSPQFPRGILPVARVRVYGGQASIGEVDIRDVRQPFGFIPTGTAGGATGLAGGDLTGSYPNPQVAGLYGYSLLNTAPAEGDVLMFTGSAWRPIPFDSHTHPMTVTNSSGAAVVAGDIGYLDEAGEFQTTTTAQDSSVVGNGCAVTTGGNDSTDIEVIKSGSMITINYTGSAPSQGDFLVTSTTAGSAQTQSTMRPEIFAVCTANGAGGTVETLLLIQTAFVPYTSSNQLQQSPVGMDDSDWNGTIATLPGGAVLTYSTSTGDENWLNAISASALAKLVLHNTTRGDSALISDTDTATNTITLTANVPGTWVTTDVITIRSQTNTDTSGGAYFLDYEITSEVPALARAMISELIWVELATAGQRGEVHTFEAFSSPKSRYLDAKVLGVPNSRTITVPLIERRYTVRGNTGGSATCFLNVFINGYILASP